MKLILIMITVLGISVQCNSAGSVNDAKTASATSKEKTMNSVDKMESAGEITEVKTITIKSKDGLPITADIYAVENSSKPTILLFHQAGYSRGEYVEIAPKLNELGYSCIAIDQRSGKKINGVENETHLAAKKENKKTEFVDAIDDLRATIDYALHEFGSKEVILWGSSYSSSLVLILGNEYADKVAGILSFAPGEYFTYQGKKIEDFAAGLNKPVFITSAKNEHKNWKAIFDKIPAAAKTHFLPTTKGYHGSKALWEENDGYEEYWKNVIAFLGKI